MDEQLTLPDREEQARVNRERMPQTAVIVAEFRRVFGPGVRVLWASEDGIEVGTRGPVGVPITLPQIVPEGKQ